MAAFVKKHSMSFLLLSALLVQSFSVQAEQIDVHGSTELRSVVELDDPIISVNEIVVRPELSYDINADLRLLMIGHLRFDNADKLEPGSSGINSPSRSTLSGRWHPDQKIDIEIREAYADYYAGDWFFRAGKQQVVWGQADGLRVLDQVNPFDFREFILGDAEDRRIPLWMLNAERSIGTLNLQLLWIPDHTYADHPERGTFSSSSVEFRPQIPSGFVGRVQSVPIDRPNAVFKDDDFGVRLTGFTSGWDWSVNGLYTYDDQLVIEQQYLPPDRLNLNRTYRRNFLFGGTASNAFGKTTVRAEAAYNSRKFYYARERIGRDGVEQSGEFNSVIGLDYQLDGDTLISGQIFISILNNDNSTIVRDRGLADLTFLLRRDLFNETVGLEGLFLHSLNQNDGVAQLSITCKYNDELEVKTGVDVFYGASTGKFGQFRSRDRVYLSLEYGF